MLLGAYYYLWWGRPTLPIVGAGVRRWGYTNHSIFGEYNSRNEKVINQQIDWARATGIDFFAVCWADSESWDDITLRDYYLKNLKSQDLKFCLHYDGIRALNRYGGFYSYPSYDLDESYTPTKTKGEKLLEDFEYFAKTYFHLPQYLKIEGKPVVILYNASAFRNVEKYFKRLPATFLIADVVCWPGLRISKKNLAFFWQNPPKDFARVVYRAIRRLFLKSYEKDFSLSKYFSAITGYNLYSISRLENFLTNVDSLYQKFWKYARSNNLYFIPNVMPGYDDRNLMGLDRPVLKRENGKFYQDFFKIAKKYLDPKLPLVMLTTFNEWHEGTEIEPSEEYGSQYLELTKSLKANSNK